MELVHSIIWIHIAHVLGIDTLHRVYSYLTTSSYGLVFTLRPLICFLRSLRIEIDLSTRCSTRCSTTSRYRSGHRQCSPRWGRGSRGIHGYCVRQRAALVPFRRQAFHHSHLVFSLMRLNFCYTHSFSFLTHTRKLSYSLYLRRRAFK